MKEWANVLIDRWNSNKWMNGCMKGLMSEWTIEGMNGCMSGRMNERTNAWNSERLDGWMDELLLLFHVESIHTYVDHLFCYYKHSMHTFLNYIHISFYPLSLSMFLSFSVLSFCLSTVGSPSPPYHSFFQPLFNSTQFYSIQFHSMLSIPFFSILFIHSF